MHGSKRRFADWTCPECKANESSCADDRSSKPASSAQASAASLSALGNTTQCQDTKPAANEDRKEMQSLSRISHGNKRNMTFPCKECGVVRPFTDFPLRDPTRVVLSVDKKATPTCRFGKNNRRKMERKNVALGSVIRRRARRYGLARVTFAFKTETSRCSRNTIIAICIPPVLHVNTRLATYVAMSILSQRAQ